MSSKRRLRRRSCTSKVRYASSDAAHRARKAAQRREHRGRLNVYRCRFCKGWHFGRPKRRRWR